MRVACLQLSSGERLEENLRIVERLFSEAAAAGVQLALLPEMFPLMSPDDEHKRTFAATRAGQIVLPFLARQAAQRRMIVIGGSLLLPGTGTLLRNCCPVFSAAGELLAGYDKIHLFDCDLPDRSYRESEQIAAGDRPCLVDLDRWRLGLSICYDLRFAELYRLYARQGANLLALPAAFTVPTGQAHWEILLRARAIENQAYVLAAAQIGSHPGGRKTYGHSMIIDPWGDIVAQARNDSENGELVIADLDLHRVEQVRLRLPALRHRRDELLSSSG